MKKIITVFILLIPICYVYSHSGYKQHSDEMLGVFGFEKSKELSDWAKFISSDMIDKHQPFYDELKFRHPGFACKHRLLFHWGYNSIPWSGAFENKVNSYCKKVNAVSVKDTVELFKDELKREQKRRNYLINEKTENVFGLSHKGKDAVYANRIASIAYNIHLLGDYTSDNTDLEGVMDIQSLIGSIVTDIKTLDRVEGKTIVNGITKINRDITDTQLKADAMMAYMQEEFPNFFKKVNGGFLYNFLKNKGIKFKE